MVTHGHALTVIHVEAVAFQVNHDNVANWHSHTAEPHFLSPSIVLVLTHTEYFHMWHSMVWLTDICYTPGPSVGDYL